MGKDDRLPFDVETAHFDGETYEAEHDQARLGSQMAAVWRLMTDGEWRTLREVEDILGYPTTSISARLRDVRKKQFGAHTLERRRRDAAKRGIHEYRIIQNPQQRLAPAGSE